MNKGRKIREAQLRAQLAGRGLRVTPQRLSVLRALGEQPRALSHGELTGQIDPAQMDRATVYRNLMTLAEAGLVLRTQLGDGVWRYELLPEEGPGHGAHPHLVCTDCGQVRCLPASAVRVERALGPMVEVQLRGRCQTCRQS